MNENCFMFKEKLYGCGGAIDMSICGETCPFQHTLEEQKAIEKQIVKRLEKIGFSGEYRSRINNEVLFKGGRACI